MVDACPHLYSIRSRRSRCSFKRRLSNAEWSFETYGSRIPEWVALHIGFTGSKTSEYSADELKKGGTITFDVKFDKMIVVFDADKFERELINYEQVIENGLKRNILGITNPSFELFLLLHYENSVEEVIRPNEEEIIQNNWVGTGSNRKRYIESIFRIKSGMRPKKTVLLVN